MTKFTKGPWVAEGCGGGYLYVSANYGEFVTTAKIPAPIHSIPYTLEEAEANAALIAAAPELFEALQEMMAWAGEIAGDNSDTEAAKIEISAVEKARAALAKATGDVK